MLVELEENALERTRAEDRISRRLSPLFPAVGPRGSTSASEPSNLEAGFSKRDSQVLVASSPDIDCLENVFEGDFDVDDIVSSKDQAPGSNTDPFGGEDSMLQNAAFAAESEWLTEALMQGGDSTADFH